MTGPQHYAEAERLLALSHRAEGAPVESIKVLVAQAQVHATLAAAAATIDTAAAGDIVYRGQWEAAFVPDEEDQNA